MVQQYEKSRWKFYIISVIYSIIQSFPLKIQGTKLKFPVLHHFMGGFATIFIVDTFMLQIHWDILPAKLNETEKEGK